MEMMNKYITLGNYSDLFGWKKWVELEQWEQNKETLEAELRGFRKNYFLRCE